MLETWQQALDYLYGLTNWETRPPGTVPEFELDRVRRLLGALGDPQEAWPAVHVGGTNGKGSTCAVAAAGLSAAGLRVGLYTSPHLHTVRERIRVNGRIVSEERVLRWLNDNRVLLRTEPSLTTFEALTAMAFSVFAEDSVDVAVVEVGLGGRLDTTNVVAPAVTVLTAIGLDHTEVLGDGIAAIAEEKCGILRPGVTAVSAPQSREALDVIESAARRIGSPLVLLGRDVEWSYSECRRDGRALRIETGCGEGTRSYSADVPLRPPYAMTNAATAAAALDVLSRAGWSLAAEDIVLGLSSAVWPARFEVLGHAPPVVIDGAHNTQAAEALMVGLADCFDGEPLHLILGASRGKDVGSFLKIVLPGADSVVTARADHPRAWSAVELAELAAQLGAQAHAAESATAALEVALEAAHAGGVVVATGSLFLAADVREACLALLGRELPPRDPPTGS